MGYRPNIEFEGNGFYLVRRDGELYICYDNGHLVTKMEDDPITPEEGELAKQSEAGAYKVILAAQKRRKG